MCKLLFNVYHLSYSADSKVKQAHTDRFMWIYFGSESIYISSFNQHVCYSIGVSAFMYEQYRIKIHVENGQADKQTKQTITVNADSYKFGILLVLGSLTFDGLLATVQDKLKLNYTLQTYDMMYYVNVFSSILLFVAFIVSGELMSFRKMFGEESLIFFYLLLSGISSAVGQNFIYYTLTQFGPLTVSIMTTVRKFCNVFVLVLYFKHAFTMRLWIYVVIVFSGLGLDIWAQQQIGK